MEYLIITGLVGAVAIVAVKNLGTTMRDRLNEVKVKLNREIQIN
jgi:Flp pilus assembly pilin Flp